MKKLLGGLGLLTLMAFSVFAVPSQADTVKQTKKPTVTPRYHYDASKEVTLKGTISSVVKQPSKGMLIGEHLMLSTSSGSVDAHIGAYSSRDKRLNKLAAGQSISVTGEKMNVRGRDVFIVRTLESEGKTIPVRNTHGFFVGSTTSQTPRIRRAKGGSR